MTDTSKGNGSKGEILKMTADVVAAYVGNNSLPTGEVSDVISIVYGSLHGLERLGGKPRRWSPKALCTLWLKNPA